MAAVSTVASAVQIRTAAAAGEALSRASGRFASGATSPRKPNLSRTLGVAGCDIARDVYCVHSEPLVHKGAFLCEKESGQGQSQRRFCAGAPRPVECIGDRHASRAATHRECHPPLARLPASLGALVRDAVHVPLQQPRDRLLPRLHEPAPQRVLLDRRRRRRRRKHLVQREARLARERKVRQRVRRELLQRFLVRPRSGCVARERVRVGTRRNGTRGEGGVARDSQSVRRRARGASMPPPRLGQDSPCAIRPRQSPMNKMR